MTKHIVLYGIVQGVGMRFYCRQTARRMGVRGYVKNVSNGTVEMIAQGDEDLLSRFVNHIKTSSPGQLDDVVVEIVEVDKRYRNFGVKF
jgi:acylphosphatase